jgi:prepilin-type N-terminal cleavage/methylation domain-containing protein
MLPRARKHSLGVPCRGTESSPLAALRKRILSDQSGFSLIELLVASALLAIVLVATFQPLHTTARVQTRDVAWAEAVQDGRIGLQRLARELRQAYSIKGAAPNSVDFQIDLGGQDLRVLYQCDVPYPSTPDNPHASSYRRCVRVQAVSGAAFPALSTGQVIIDRLLNGTATDPVFSYTPNTISPKFIGAKVKLPARRTLSEGLNHSIVFQQGAYLRNLNLGA